MSAPLRVQPRAGGQPGPRGLPPGGAPDLLDYLGPAPLHVGAWATGAGERRLVLTRTSPRGDGLLRRRDRYTLQGRRLDGTRFAADAERVVEYARDDGAGFAAMPPLAVPRRPGPGDAPALIYAGAAELIWPDRSEDADVLGLAAGDSVQWFARGVGEIWVGRGGAPGRWLLGWLGPDGPRFGGLPAAFRDAWAALRR